MNIDFICALSLIFLKVLAMPEIITQKIQTRNGIYFMSYSNKEVFDPYSDIERFGYGDTIKQSIDMMKEI